MRFRISIGCVVLAGMLLSAGQADAQSQDQQKFLLQGDVALWTVAIKPDKTADFEQVLNKLRTALHASDKPERQAQGKGWKVLRLKTPLPDGNVAYVHVVTNPIPDADYAVMRILYEAYPDEARAIYDLYSGAFAGSRALAAGSLVIDLAKTP